MKKYLLLTTMAMTLAMPSLSWSQSAPTGQPPQGGPPSASGSQPQQGGGDEHFQEHKSEILTHLNAHLAEVQQRISCVQAASNHQALKACMPEKGAGPGQAPGNQ